MEREETFYIEGFHQSEGRKSLYLQNFKVRNITDGAGIEPFTLHCEVPRERQAKF